MKMIERTPHHGNEIQLFELTPEEIDRYSRKDRRTRRRAILRWWASRILNFIV